MDFITCDLEGVFVPEIWIEVAKRLGIEALKITTREEKDYDKLMKMRIKTLHDNKVTFNDVSKIISQIDVLKGADTFLDKIRKIAPVAIVSDTFQDFFNSGFSAKLNYPMIFCHNLVIKEGYIADYNIRIDNSKKNTIQALHNLNYRIFAFGDSYNDIDMIKNADGGSLFNPPKNIIEEYPEIPHTDNYDVLYDKIEKFINN